MTKTAKQIEKLLMKTARILNRLESRRARGEVRVDELRIRLDEARWKQQVFARERAEATGRLVALREVRQLNEGKD